ncbi:TlpA disulfide reductase family protein [Dysgonomonas sp. ZJ709]|uniref:TlpA family protein disulfide reductase n=1 Tax=Dysgonomonas sp. ZJ709 TaxID=2709797 RepID=UPI0013EB091F|nr:TlpA disulfide reductase family protein [Dysgonomonas sp. ZJ709]
MHLFKAFILFITIFLSVIVKGQSNGTLIVPHIQSGVAELTGKLTGNNEIQSKTLSLSVGNPITSERTEYEIPIKEDGSFSQSVSLTSINIGNIRSDIYNGGVPLIPGKKTILNITFDDSKGDKKVDLKSDLGVTADDMMNITDAMMEILMQPIRPDNYNMSPQALADYTINRMGEILKTLEANTKLSDTAKQLVEINAKLFYLDNILLDYNGIMNITYMRQHKVDSVPSDFHLKEPDKSYYSVLKEFNLNDPICLYADYYPIVLQSLLKNQTLNIPSIGETPITDWLVEAKAILQDCIGSDNGLFYDLLVASAYNMQLKEMIPLTKVQIKNIQAYYKESPFIDILFNENNRVIQLGADSQALVVNEKTAGLMDSIVSKYKGKVIFVDFWATWCGPCLTAMKESKQIKEEFDNKGVIFVYITNDTSPRRTWQQKISEMKGEHYYLSSKEWDEVLDQFGFSSIPTYLIYNKEGELKHKSTPFMGAKNMKEWIDELLQDK